jgi:cytochrome c-type biogenesis protein CcmE
VLAGAREEKLKQPAKFTIGGAIIVATVVWLGWIGVRQSKTYYHTIAELQSLSGAARRQRMRVSGDVVKGSIRRLSGRVDFVLEEQGRSLPVSYVGTDPLPDTFQGGAQALVEGHEMPDGRFVAEEVQAKCASKYQAMPGAPAKAAPQPGSSSQAGSSSSRKS